MSKKNKYGEITWRKIKPQSRIPTDIIEDFLKKEPKAIEEAKLWIEEHGLTILFVQNIAKGAEKVWVSDDGIIYMCEESEPSLKDLTVRCRIAKMSAEKLEELGTDKKKILKELQKIEKPL
jgi:hypothetical protein